MKIFLLLLFSRSGKVTVEKVTMRANHKMIILACVIAAHTAAQWIMDNRAHYLYLNKSVCEHKCELRVCISRCFLLFDLMQSACKTQIPQRGFNARIHPLHAYIMCVRAV